MKNLPDVIKLAMKVCEEYESTINSAYDRKRFNTMCELIDTNIERFYNGEPIDSGIYGKVFELSLHRSESTITKVHSVKYSYDFYIKMSDGKLLKAESKTNGGRIGWIDNMPIHERKAKAIIYNLAYVKPAGKRPRKDGTFAESEIRYITVCTTIYDFVKILESTKATKVIGHNDSDRELAIQCDSKKLYNELLNHKDIKFDRNKAYTKEELYG